MIYFGSPTPDGNAQELPPGMDLWIYLLVLGDVWYGLEEGADLVAAPSGTSEDEVYRAIIDQFHADGVIEDDDYDGFKAKEPPEGHFLSVWGPYRQQSGGHVWGIPRRNASFEDLKRRLMR